MNYFFLFFFVSGFCSLVYEIVWMRLAMAAFGVNTPLISIFLSCFMGGLGLGCWAVGRQLARENERSCAYYLRSYALTELLIGIGGVAVPGLLTWQRDLLNAASSPAAWDSGNYFLASGACIACAVVPWAAFMGATLPLGMAAIRRRQRRGSERSFSYLYMANVLGAAAGCLGSAFVMIESLGFQGSLRLAAVLNVLLAASILALSLRREKRPEAREPARRPQALASTRAPKGILWMLFASGALSMAMEIVWTRQYTGYLGTHVYAFASILWVYLIATFLGSQTYRAWAAGVPTPKTGLLVAALGLLGLSPLALVEPWLPRVAFRLAGGPLAGADEAALLFMAAYLAAVAAAARACWTWLKKKPASPGPAWTLIGAASLWPLVFADPFLPLPVRFTNGAIRLILGIAPFCFCVGFATSWLMDLRSQGDPERAADAYAANMLGCILGPLAAGFFLLPQVGERWALFWLSLPFLLLGLAASRRRGLAMAAAAAALGLTAASKGIEDFAPGKRIKRDSTATVAAWGEGLRKNLAINGVPGITLLVPETKMMAHLPLAFLPRRPRNALVICFGMGTTFRSALSWGIDATAVELVPSVPAFFGYFFEDAAELLGSPRARVIIDDGRRFLERSREQFDVITLDPPPPIQSAGLSLLYSKEFYGAAKRRLKPGGILQQWCVPGDPAVAAAAAEALRESFPYVRAFLALDEKGIQFLASEGPLPPFDAVALAAHMPASAARDLVEWGPSRDPRAPFRRWLDEEIPVESLLPPGSRVSPISDDRPFNEYFLLRILRKHVAGEAASAKPDS